MGMLSAAAVLLLVIAAGSLGWAVWQLRADARRDAFEETGNLAVVLAGQLSRFLQTIDVVVAEVRDDVNELNSETMTSWQQALSGESMHEKLKGKLARIPQAFNIAVADAGGQVLASTARWPAPAINIADRDYFRNARAQERDELAISSPIRNRVNGEVTLAFARSLKDSKGAFIGIVYVAVNSKYFEIIYDSIRSVRDLTFILALTNGTMLVRHPQQNDLSGQRIPQGSPWYDAIARGGGSFVTPGTFGGQERLASVRLLQGFPMAVAVSTSFDAAFSRWRTQAIVLTLGGAVFVACSLTLLVVVRREMRSLAASETSLREKSESLEQSIVERSAMEKRLVQSQKLEAVGQLTGGIAHDFNNLLLVVIGNLDLLKDTTPAGSLEMELIESWLTAALTGSELSNSLFAFSRQYAFKPETVDLKEMKGQVKVTSEVGKGTTFILLFPRATQLLEMAAPALVPADVQASERRREAILVVDDDDLVRKSVVAQMRSLGYSTLEANSPAEALALIAGTEPFDLLFSDVVMPGPMDGVELARQAREHRPDLKVMLTSGYPDLKSARSSEASCVQWRILKKPYRRRELQQALAEMLGTQDDGEQSRHVRACG